MNTLFSQISLFSSSILLKSARSIVGSSSIYGICSNLSCKSSLIKNSVSVKSSNLGSSTLSKFGVVQCCYYSTKRVSTRKRKSTAKTEMEDEKNAFFVVRKGDIVGVYKSLSDCQAQVGSSICDPPVSVYKGYSLPSEAEEHLVSRGLQNALYTIKASDLNVELFGTLVPCPFQDTDRLLSTFTVPSNKIPKLDNVSCDSICKIRQGLGTATNNVAEYQAVILGLKRALEMGYTSIRVKGDSKLVCMQIQGLWKVKNQNMADLHAQATILKNKFASFQISHVLRELNSDADAQANLGVNLASETIFPFFMMLEN
ncbi:hypothetical protein KSS87_002368 [Heliosperma pusillum]|nr:hypothetical protein KSS87_002368 [Heliosperma pusillum]